MSDVLNSIDLTDPTTVNAAPSRLVEPPTVPSFGTRRRLIATDLVALVVGWSIALVGPTANAVVRAAVVAPLVCAIAASLGLMFAQHLYRTRICSLRSRELLGTARSCLGGAIAALALAQVAGLDIPVASVAVGTLASYAFVATGRGVFSSWLRSERAAGRRVRRILLVGDNAEALELETLVRSHPELGYQVCGYVGAPNAGLSAPWLGEIATSGRAARTAGATGALVAISALHPTALNTVVRQLLGHGLHVRITCGLRGVTQQRLVAAPLAHEPAFYVERRPDRRWHVRFKRVVDVTISATVLLVTAPAIAVIAAAIKLDSPGPVLFRQQRAGRGGTPFAIHKFRTMTADAEGQQAQLRAHNQRSGPLFKLSRDPRVTRVGRMLRATSLDELPQLIDVLEGTMSLVGPRPLPLEEAAAVTEHLPRRTHAKPGVTGLWQVEARDNPAFEPLRRLDAFYLENASPGLDLRILAATATHVTTRTLRALRSQTRSQEQCSDMLD